MGNSTQGISCDMTGGSSGAGWLTGGAVNGVNSCKYDFDPSTLYGPYFGDVAREVYTDAANG